MKGQNGRRSSWTGVRLGDVVEPRETRNPSKEGPGQFLYVDIEAVDNGSQRITSPKRIANTSAPSRARMALRGGDVLFSLVRPYLKNIAIVPPELHGSVASTAYCVLRPKERVDSRFLFYQLIQDNVINSVPTYGTSPPAARDEEFLNTVIRMTTGPEQTRIADKLDELFSDLDAGVAALERAKANLARYRAAVLKAAVEGNVTEQWRRERPNVEPAPELLKRILARRRNKWEEEQPKRQEAPQRKPSKVLTGKYKEPAGPEDSGWNPPPKWTVTSLGQIAFFQNGRAFPSKEYSSEGAKLLRPGNLYADGSVRWTSKNTRYLPPQWQRDHPEYVVAGDELIINLTAQSLADEFLGRVCLTSHNELCLLNQRLARITPLPGVRKRYLLYVLKSALFRRFVNGLNTGSLIQHMFTSDLHAFAFPLPPEDEQHEIVASIERIMSVVEVVASAIATQEDRAKSLRQSVLAFAFAGGLSQNDGATL